MKNLKTMLGTDYIPEKVDLLMSQVDGKLSLKQITFKSNYSIIISFMRQCHEQKTMMERYLTKNS